MAGKNIFDVIIIGGGPAGSTAATLLARKGHSVMVFEKEKFPREHVGESLLPFCYEMFEELGVLEEMKKRFVRKPGIRFIDANNRRFTTWCFRHVIKNPSYLSFHVIRAEFDKLLLDNARKNGAQVKEQTRVQKVELNGGVEVSVVGPRGMPETFGAKFLLDASGRDTFLANRMSLKRPHPDLDRTALSTHWIGGKYTDGLEEGLLHINYLGGEKKGWIWVIPVGTDRLSVGVVMNHSYIRQEKAKLVKMGEKNWHRALYLQEIMVSKFVCEVLEGARIAQPLMVNGDYSYAIEKKYGENFALVGDASIFIDPIFATGVQMAMASSRLVSQAIHTKLTSSNGAGEASFAEAYRNISGAYRLVEKLIGVFYKDEVINWAQLGSASELVENAQVRAWDYLHFLLAGDFFRRHEEYSKLIDLMQDPKLFNRYKRLVSQGEVPQAATCGLSRVEVFNKLMKVYEKRRAATARRLLREAKEGKVLVVAPK